MRKVTIYITILLVNSLNGIAAPTLTKRPVKYHLRTLPDGRIVKIIPQNRKPKPKKIPPKKNLTAETTQTSSKRLANFSLVTSLSFLRIDGKDENGTTGYIASGPSPSMRLIWRPQISNRVRLDVGALLQKATFNQAREKTITSPDQTITRFFIGANYQMTTKLKADLQLGRNDQIFYQAIDTQTIQVKTVKVNNIQLGLQYGLGSIKQISLGISGAYRYQLPYSSGDFSGNPGTGYTGSFLARKSFKTFSLQSSVFYSKDYFPQKDVDFDRAELGFSLGVSKAF